ncbi:MAG: hypothetical protein AUK47_02450 [Deltaproteobacteria bacterium CG2_30_63_29]|nr:MAG: hypothetical protein AUK47_02450 [Deltaproteobacteria bacterium CG2_30_63_29]PJB38372.1 MAG: hypothetical protein CO108_19195 [Deltaproteobacteria bacterium CG_4_9_14_3_um_filter_63_12]
MAREAGREAVVELGVDAGLGVAQGHSTHRLLRSVAERQSQQVVSCEVVDHEECGVFDLDRVDVPPNCENPYVRRSYAECRAKRAQ